MSLITKAKVNVKEGTIELEGSEVFVARQLEAFLQMINQSKYQIAEGSPTPPIEHSKEETEKILGKKKVGKSTQAVIPIPLDLKAKDGKPSLRDFYKTKNPANQSESVTVFAYYLKEHLKIERMEAGHVSSCCKEVNIKVPTSISQMFYDIHRDKGWLNLEDGRRLAIINTAGENFVIHDLPRKDNVKSDKATT